MKQNKLSNLLMMGFLLISIAITSCTESDFLVDDHSRSLPFTDTEMALMSKMFTPHKVSRKEAYELALQTMNGNGGMPSKSSRRRSAVDATGISCNPITISNDSVVAAMNELNLDLQDTIAYLFTDNINGGFTIVSADYRVDEQILAYVDDGTIIEGDTLNEMASFIVDMLCGYYLDQLIEYKAMKDSLENDVYNKLEALELGGEMQTGEDEEGFENPMPTPSIKFLGVTSRPLTDWTYSNVVEPLVPVTWGQGKPYNDSVFCYSVSHSDMINAKTGCVATAVAQLMAFWQYPSVVGNMTMDWEAITSTPSISSYETTSRRSQVAYLLKVIGKGIGTSYGVNSSGAKTSNARDWMKRHGYKGGGKYDFDYNRVKSSLLNGWPVLARGNRNFHGFKIFGYHIGKYSGGHSWIVDGCKERTRLMEVTISYIFKGQTVTHVRTIPQSEKWLYCNWGWYGSSNGWLPAGSFNVPKVVQMTRTGDLISVGTENYNYKYNKEIFVRLRPQHIQ